VKRYGSLAAVDHVGLDVRRGEIFGILGPNGAGKTTTLEMLEGLREPDEGTIIVDGTDVVRHPEQVKRRIGLQLQTTALFDRMTVAELVALFASLYGADASRERVEQLLALVSLTEKMDDVAETLSGGQQQRLSIALALVNDPVIVFLDEPTTGLDPQARRSLWDVVEGIRSEGTTVMLTTHYMEEAESLCDRVAIMDHGKVILCDTPARLIDTLDVRASISAQFARLHPPIDELRRLPGVVDVDVREHSVTMHSSTLQDSLRAFVSLVDRQDIKLENLSTSRPTLEDVFLHYTGRGLRE
jgi:ABC-2 type transport system ATP-binding protein